MLTRRQKVGPHSLRVHRSGATPGAPPAIKHHRRRRRSSRRRRRGAPARALALALASFCLHHVCSCLSSQGNDDVAVVDWGKTSSSLHTGELESETHTHTADVDPPHVWWLMVPLGFRSQSGVHLCSSQPVQSKDPPTPRTPA